MIQPHSKPETTRTQAPVTTGGSSRKRIACAVCGRSLSVGEEALAATCGQCLVRAPRSDPGTAQKPAKAGRGLRRAVGECCNFVGDECVMQDSGRCAVLEGERCAWFERAVLPTCEPLGPVWNGYAGGAVISARQQKARACPDCGAALAKRQRVCSKCGLARRRKAYRRHMAQTRAACLQLRPQNVPLALAPGGAN